MIVAARFRQLYLTYLSVCAFQVYAQWQPRNITRAAGETDIYIPCPFEFHPTPSIWRINGIDFTTATIPSTLYSLTTGGLFINTVFECMNQTSYQCIDTSDNVLQEQVSEIGYLTVISNEICPDGGQEQLLLGTTRAGLELDHHSIQYGNATTSLVWKIVPPNSGCNISHILSYRECEQNSPDINETIDDTSITIPSVNLSMGGHLIDFAISSLSDQESLECPRLAGTVRFNVTQTEQINLLLGNNNCTSIPMKRQGGLSFAISNPNINEVDTICPIYAPANQCYSPGTTCTNFNDNFNIAPFFQICEDQSANLYNLSFGNVTHQLNGTRLDFFIATKTVCTTSVYFTRTYVRSFELTVTNVSSDTSINVTSRQMCFSSQSIDCNITLYTLYNVSVIDIFNNSIFKMDKIPESTCLIVDQLGLLPQCGPFIVITRPFNDYIMYDRDTETQQITLDNNKISTEPNLCSCLEATTQLQLTIEYSSPELLLKVDYQCSTLYASQVQITISDSTLRFTNVTMCSEGILEFSVDSDLCGTDINFCGYFTFENGSAFTNCALSCSIVSVIICPTTPTTPVRGINHNIVVAVGCILPVIIITVIIILCIIFNARVLWYSQHRISTHYYHPYKP